MKHYIHETHKKISIHCFGQQKSTMGEGEIHVLCTKCRDKQKTRAWLLLKTE